MDGVGHVVGHGRCDVGTHCSLLVRFACMCGVRGRRSRRTCRLQSEVKPAAVIGHGAITYVLCFGVRTRVPNGTIMVLEYVLVDYIQLAS